jgi:hypothetical protein
MNNKLSRSEFLKSMLGIFSTLFVFKLNLPIVEPDNQDMNVQDVGDEFPDWWFAFHFNGQIYRMHTRGSKAIQIRYGNYYHNIYFEKPLSKRLTTLLVGTKERPIYAFGYSWYGQFIEDGSELSIYWYDETGIYFVEDFDLA